MKGKRILSFLAAAGLCMNGIPLQTAAVTDTTAVSDWAELQECMAQGGDIVLSNDVIWEEGLAVLEVPEGVTVTIDLNGCKIDRNLKEYDRSRTDGNVITNYGTLTISDSNESGMICGGKNNWQGYSGGIDNYGTLNLLGGSISENTYYGEKQHVVMDNGNDDDYYEDDIYQGNGGGGVYNHADAVLLIDGGEIRGNYTSLTDGGGIYNCGTVTLNSGAIANNRTFADDDSDDLWPRGGGVYNAKDAVFTMNGGEITGNRGQGNGAGIYNAGTLELNGGIIGKNWRETFYDGDHEGEIDDWHYRGWDTDISWDYSDNWVILGGAVYNCGKIILGEASYLFASERWDGTDAGYIPENWLVKNISNYGYLEWHSEPPEIMWTLEDGVLTISGAGEMKNNGLAPWYKFSKSIQKVVIEEGITSIGDSAFQNCTGLTEFTIPDGVTSIGNSAFCFCTGLTSVTIPDSVTSIGDTAFYECTGLTNIIIPDSVTRIGGSAFSGCNGLTDITIPESVTNIGASAFSGTAWLSAQRKKDPCVIVNHILIDGKTCNGIITIPDGVTTIGDYAFGGCKNLTSITIPESVTSIGAGAFQECKSLKLITILNPNCEIYNSSSTIYNDKDWDCDSQYYEYWYFGVICGYENSTAHNYAKRMQYEFQSLNYSQGVQILPDSNISWWIENYTLTISGTGEMKNSSAYSSESAPWRDYYFNKAVIEEGVTSIGNYVFKDCIGLEEIIIPDSVTSIGNHAFQDCDGLKEITIPDSVTNIGNYAFQNCTGLEEITIPDSVTSIRQYVFSNCSGLTDIIIPESITIIGNAAFEDCTSLTVITIPENVTKIGDSAFARCSGLREITIKNPDCQIYDRTSIISNDKNGFYRGVIRGYVNSTAQAYAQKYGYIFEPLGVPGDVDCSGTVDVSDAVLLARLLAEDAGAVVTDTGKANADVNGDGIPTSDDVVMILKAIARLISL